MPESTGVVERDAARIILLDEQDRVLLFRCKEPNADRSFWITPGGGLESGETFEHAARRELREETGLAGISLGPCVWIRCHTFSWLETVYKQYERFYLLRVADHEVDPAEHTSEEQAVLIEHRWWSVDEIHAATDESFAPGSLARHMRALLHHTPTEPIDVGA